MSKTVSNPIVAEDTAWSFAHGQYENKTADVVLAKRSRFIFDFPTVYVTYALQKNTGTYLVYVGETNDIESRTLQHFANDSKNRDDWEYLNQLMLMDKSSVRQFVIGHPHFNKSLTLDIENRLMHYLLGVDSVARMNNRRANPQGNYYTRDELDKIFELIWHRLSKRSPCLFPPLRIVKDSALFKASPFHELSEKQLVAEKRILDVVHEASSIEGNVGEFGRLILVLGGAGTGKTVLISHLFNQLSMSNASNERDAFDGAHNRSRGTYLLVNHKEQATVYNQIALKLCLQSHADEVVLKPSTFINTFSDKRMTAGGRSLSDVSKPSGRADIVLIDEAHLLLTQGNQGYQGSNMLLDIMRRAKTTIAVFDPAQILESSQQWKTEDLEALLCKREGAKTGEFRQVALSNGVELKCMTLELDEQFRIEASHETVAWIDKFAKGEGIGPIPRDCDSYEIKVFDSPIELYEAIREKNRTEAGSRGLSRVLATYDWPYSSKQRNPADPAGRWNVELHKTQDGTWGMGLAEDDRTGFVADDDLLDSTRFCHPWNYMLGSATAGRRMEKRSWAERPDTIDEVGSTFTIQGFDLNYAGLIVGPSVKYRNGKILFDGSASKNTKATNKRDGTHDYSEQNLRNELNVLLKRGVHGLYLFAVDRALQVALKRAADE